MSIVFCQSGLALTACMNSEVSSDGKSLVNPPSKSRSKAYGEFVEPITNGNRGGFDIHIYFMQSDEFETKYARELHERIRRECKTEMRLMFHQPPD